MSSITLALSSKSLRLAVSSEATQQRLAFQATLPKPDCLRTSTGETIARGYVEFVFERPRFSEPTLHFSAASEDPDSGKKYSESLSFYATLSVETFVVLRDLPPSASVSLHLVTEILGPIQFTDALGFDMTWNTEQYKVVPVAHFEVVVSYAKSDA
jgi:hypothetical protein